MHSITKITPLVLHYLLQKKKRKIKIIHIKNLLKEAQITLSLKEIVIKIQVIAINNKIILIIILILIIIMIVIISIIKVILKLTLMLMLLIII
jgi:hypothetical protein